jgi:hypothetical protein
MAELVRKDALLARQRLELPGTFVKCLAGGHFYACVRGDEECPICEKLAERDAEITRLTQALKHIAEVVPTAGNFCGIAVVTLEDYWTLQRIARAVLSPTALIVPQCRACGSTLADRSDCHYSIKCAMLAPAAQPAPGGGK